MFISSSFDPSLSLRDEFRAIRSSASGGSYSSYSFLNSTSLTFFSTKLSFKLVRKFSSLSFIVVYSFKTWKPFPLKEGISRYSRTYMYEDGLQNQNLSLCGRSDFS